MLGRYATSAGITRSDSKTYLPIYISNLQPMARWFHIDPFFFLAIFGFRWEMRCRRGGGEETWCRRCHDPHIENCFFFISHIPRFRLKDKIPFPARSTKPIQLCPCRCSNATVLVNPLNLNARSTQRCPSIFPTPPRRYDAVITLNKTIYSITTASLQSPSA
jgi:hypothetical protein